MFQILNSIQILYCKNLSIYFQNALLKDMNSLASTAAKNVKEKSEQVVPKICESRIAQSIESLLAEDCLKPVKIMCAKIATRMAMERIDQWLQSHIMGGFTFIKNMEFELNRAFKNNDDVVVDKKCHNSNAACPTDVLDDMRVRKLNNFFNKYVWANKHGQIILINHVIF